MKNKIILIFLVCFAFVSCKQNSKNVLSNAITTASSNIIASIHTTAFTTNIKAAVNTNQQAVKPAKKSLTKRLLKWFFISLFVAALPLIIGIGGGYLSSIITGKPCTNEGNCKWSGFIWLTIFSIPAGIILFVVMAIVCLIN